MQYFALLISEEKERTPDEGAAEMAAYQSFHTKAAAAIRGGDALAPGAAAVRITGGPDAPAITDGPFAEGAEVAGGYYVFEAENLDEALALARDIPAAKRGGVEVWPVVHSLEPSRKLTGNDWLALLLEPPASAHTPGTPEWDAARSWINCSASTASSSPESPSPESRSSSSPSKSSRSSSYMGLRCR